MNDLKHAMKIDVHNHILSTDLFERIASQTSYKVKRDPNGNILTVIGNTMPIISIEERLAEMDYYGIDRQVLSFVIFRFFEEETLKENPTKRLKLSRVINDYLAEICNQHPNRFMAFADIPLLDINDSIDELRRSIQELGLHGATLWSNIHGIPLNSKQFWPFYAAANESKVPIFIHPTIPRDNEIFQEYHLAALVGYPFETTLAVTRLVYSGLFERFKQLKLILSHVGGAIPFLWERINRGYLNSWPGCRENISKLPTEYLKGIYYDTALSFSDALLLASRVVGDHLIFGTDYPYTSPSMSYEDEIYKHIVMIQNLDLPKEERQKIFSLNVVKIFSL